MCFTTQSVMLVVLLTSICSLRVKYLPDAISARISWDFICSWLQILERLSSSLNSSLYCSEIRAAMLHTCWWKSSTACGSTCDEEHSGITFSLVASSLIYSEETYFTLSAWLGGSGSEGLGGINIFTLQKIQVCVNNLLIVNQHSNQ